MKTRTLTICLLVLVWGSVTLPNATAAISEIVISAETVRDFGQKSPENVEFVNDPDASHGLAISFTGGANGNPVPQPTSWIEVEFRADAAEYFIWLRGKSNGDTGTDSTWFQFDDQIGTDKHTAFPGAEARGIGNWRDVFDAGIWVWAGQEVPPPGVISVKFKLAGPHKIRVQPRQTPHLVDQIWLSLEQDERPPDNNPVDWDAAKDPRPVNPTGKIAITWGKLKQSP